jgi:hypothetical protein
MRPRGRQADTARTAHADERAHRAAARQTDRTSNASSRQTIASAITSHPTTEAMCNHEAGTQTHNGTTHHRNDDCSRAEAVSTA